MKIIYWLIIASVIILIIYGIFVYINRDNPVRIAEATAVIVASPIPPIP